jgi:16S rRNA (cytidine1402-2'-O)-methyltransferase
LSFLSEGKNLGLVTDAGTPGISDPGNELISHILEREPNIKVIPIPGASALVTALSVSGFNVNRFVFLGFLPKKKRKKLLKWVKEANISFAFYESPNRLYKTLLVLSEHFGPQKRILVARELTKLHETLYRGTINQIKGELDGVKIRGEIVVVVEA